MTIFTPRPQWIVDLINELAGTAGGVWGSITGTLSAQTDLQAALNAKVNNSQISTFGATLIDDADAATARTTLGLGTAATLSTSDIDERARDAIGAALVAGTNITITPNDGADTITVATRVSRCLGSKNATQSIANLTGTALTWNVETDVGGWHDNVTNNSRFTVPSGVSRIAMTVNVRFDANTTGHRQLYVFKNGASFLGRPSVSVSANTAVGVNTDLNASFEDNCSAGDYYEAFVVQTSGGALNVINGDMTWALIKAIE